MILSLSFIKVQPVLGPPGPPPPLKPTHSVIRKIVDFICTSLFVTDSHSNRRETAMRWGQETRKKTNTLYVCLYRPCLLPSLSFAISFSFDYALLFSLQVFLFWPCASEEGGVTETREKGKDKLF